MDGWMDGWIYCNIEVGPLLNQPPGLSNKSL